MLCSQFVYLANTTATNSVFLFTGTNILQIKQCVAYCYVRVTHCKEWGKEDCPGIEL